MSASVILNLDNFDNECLSRTEPHYILTSPTSLRACSKLLLEPIELVYRSLERYEEDLAGLPLSEVYRIYEENETERQEKLLRCRQVRRSLQLKPAEAQRARLIDLRQLPKPMAKDKSHSGGSSPRKSVVLQYSSDTESCDGDAHNQPRDNSNSNSSEQKRQCAPTSKPALQSNPNRTKRHLQSCSSVPNLANKKGNLNFSKTAPSVFSSRNHKHHYLCQCPHLQPLIDEQLLADTIKSYGDLDLSKSFGLTSDDRKILQLLILKKGRALEWDKRAEELRRIIQNEKAQSARNRALASQQLWDRLAEKRRAQNLENSRRYLRIQERTDEQRLELRRYLETRDRKVQGYLKQLADQKQNQIYEKHKLEELKEAEVGRAIERLLEQDQGNRLVLAENLQKRMDNAEIRKRRIEKDHWRHIYEMNRLEDEKRTLKHEQVERFTQNSIQQLRNQLEEKEQRGALNYRNQLRCRQNLPKDRGKVHEEAILKAQQLHASLLQGLDDWYKKILELHLVAQERASQNYSQQLSCRRGRLATERSYREERSAERLRQLQQEEERKRGLVKRVIESKEMKSANIQREKERRVQFSRRRAQAGAELRQQLRDRLDPDTFDKKVARVEIELRLLRKSSGNYAKFRQINCHNCDPVKYKHGSGSGTGRPQKLSGCHNHTQ